MTAPKTLTPKQDAWLAQWIANGFNAVNAYIAVYNATNMQPAAIRREAERVLNFPAVQTRIQELRQDNPLVPVTLTVPNPLTQTNTTRPAVTRPDKPDKQWLLEASMDVWYAAVQTGNLGQAKSALELIGKITGDLVDRKELRVVRSWADLTDAEVDALAAGETIEAEIIEDAQSNDEE